VTFFSMFTAFPNDFLEFLWSKACDEVESNCKSPTAIPEITWEGPSSCSSILALTENWSKPLVIRGLRNSSQTKMGRNYWDQFGEADLFFRNQSEPYTWDGYGHTKRMRLDNLLERMDDGELLYVDFNNDLPKAHPEILEDIGLDPVICGRHGDFGEMYLGYGHAHKSTGTFTHGEILDNIMVVLQGSRQIHLNPSHCVGLIRPFISNGHCYNDCWKRNRTLERFEMESERFKFLECCELQTAVLNTGDGLYNPPWWLHDIINLPDGEKPSFTATIGVRALRVGAAFWQKWDYTLYSAIKNLDRALGLRSVEVQEEQHTPDES